MKFFQIIKNLFKNKISKEFEELIEFYQTHFRIICDYKIEYDYNSKYKLQCNINFDKKEATIFGIDKFYNKEVDKEDYILHEILHICMKEILEETDYSKRREKEEMFVQDLTEFLK